MNRGASRNARKRQAVATFDWSLFRYRKFSTRLHALGSNYIVSFAILVYYAGNPGAAVRVVFNMFNRRFDTRLELKVNQTVMLAYTAAFVTSGNTALIITPRRSFFNHQETLKRFLSSDTNKVLAGHAAAGRSSRLVSFNGHYFLPSSLTGLASSSVSKKGSLSPSLSVT